MERGIGAMTQPRLNKMLFSTFILVCLICLVANISLLMPFMPQSWTWGSLNHDVNPMLTEPLSEYQYLVSDSAKQDKFIGESFHQVYPFIKICTSFNISYLQYYKEQKRFAYNIVKIRYLIIAHFHGSKYKDVLPLP